MKAISLILLLGTQLLAQAQELKPFKAVYEVSRDGKVTGKQVTELKRTTNNQWRLTDVLEGTRGMASVLGFERRETTTFSWHNQQLTVLEHQMQQKAAFSKRRYRFSYDPTQQLYTGEHKGDSFTTAGDQTVISAHLIPLVIGLAACQQQQAADLKLLKSKKIRDYRFTINSTQQAMTANRVFPPESQRTSQSTLDPQRMCLPTAQTHIEEDQPEVNSRLVEFTWL